MCMTTQFKNVGIYRRLPHKNICAGFMNSMYIYTSVLKDRLVILHMIDKWGHWCHLHSESQRLKMKYKHEPQWIEATGAWNCSSLQLWFIPMSIFSQFLFICNAIFGLKKHTDALAHKTDRGEELKLKAVFLMNNYEWLWHGSMQLDNLLH